MPSLSEIRGYLDATLDVDAVPDYPNAVNGVQFENEGEITHIAAAVDFSTNAVRVAGDVGARLLLVHHGMFWSGVQPITGHRVKAIRELVRRDVAVYSAHLPLDVHPQFGNNALLAKRLGLTPTGGFARFATIEVGLRGSSNIPTRAIADRARALAAEFGGTLVASPFQPDRITRAWAMCSGAGADSATLREAATLGIDTLVVGEGPHHTAVEARELGIVVLYAGHYATETLGVRALAASVSERFGIETSFIDLPTGL
ncbi:MAG TPA: Nif3-like dinuclear metal center hexameric protein [Gemmatimonadaceae bacterium]|nr:Nif3-like dinuclear metal center hexameric protein [Gemmatimonadaceae bacterium]